ncbi:hypothetical protein [Poseidonocella sp. HB161398]|uniref:hypothetical protein n=1 Tax=Poseidonocella sp. HB161398 TaxID=2320855 RepID=UPI00197D43EB|nr:hypothetical protein [Poseidonocella sp. HB161398]
MAGSSSQIARAPPSSAETGSVSPEKSEAGTMLGSTVAKIAAIRLGRTEEIPSRIPVTVGTQSPAASAPKPRTVTAGRMKKFASARRAQRSSLPKRNPARVTGVR